MNISNLNKLNDSKNPKFFNSNNTIKKWFWNKNKDITDYIKDPQYDTNTRMKVYYIIYFYITVTYWLEDDRTPEKDIQFYEDIINYLNHKFELMCENFKYNNMDGINRMINNDKNLKIFLKYGQKWAKKYHKDFPY